MGVQVDVLPERAGSRIDPEFAHAGLTADQVPLGKRRRQLQGLPVAGALPVADQRFGHEGVVARTLCAPADIVQLCAVSPGRGAMRQKGPSRGVATRQCRQCLEDGAAIVFAL